MSEAKPRRVQSKAARNERRKAAASTLIAIGAAMLAAAFFQPLATGRFPALLVLLAAISLFFASQMFAHYILSKVED